MNSHNSKVLNFFENINQYDHFLWVGKIWKRKQINYLLTSHLFSPSMIKSDKNTSTHLDFGATIIAFSSVCIYN